MDGAEKYMAEFFGGSVAREFSRIPGLRDEGIQRHVAGILVEYMHCDRIWTLRDVEGRTLVQPQDFIVESDPVFGNAPSFDVEREIRKRLGDYTLFACGMFPQGLNHSRFGWLGRTGDMREIVRIGEESYRIVAAFDEGEYRNEAGLFCKLAERFELCAAGLQRVAREYSLAK